ncbi:CECR6/TMEM121 family [Trinorchestia longiramus]|nr:CECR6/TMEM121 family [Trinorchestia longiramus]
MCIAATAATVVEWSAACVRYQVSASGRKTAGSKPGDEYELFLVSRRELALIDVLLQKCNLIKSTGWNTGILYHEGFAGKFLHKLNIGYSCDSFFIEFVQDGRNTFNPQACSAYSADTLPVDNNSHYDAARHTMRALFIANIAKNYVFEIFDSITFLSMLFIDETNMIFSFTFENTIIAFGCITLILPSVCLYNLSHSDYGRVEACAIMSFIYTMLHLFLVNVPYMSVRIYLWATMRQPVSIFLVKNIFQIILTIVEAISGFPGVRAAVLRKFGLAVTDENSDVASQTGDERSNANNRTNEERQTEDIELLCTNKSASKDNPHAFSEVFLYISVSQSGPYRPPGGVEEMQGDGRRVRLEWGVYITV